MQVGLQEADRFADHLVQRLGAGEGIEDVVHFGGPAGFLALMRGYLALGLAFRGESVHAIAIVGSVVALAGAYLVNTGVRKQPVTPRS